MNFLHLKMIYWCVSPKNKRAIRFYDKNGFKRVNPDTIGTIEGYSQELIDKLFWYSISEDKP